MRACQSEILNYQNCGKLKLLTWALVERVPNTYSQACHLDSVQICDKKVRILVPSMQKGLLKQGRVSWSYSFRRLSRVFWRVHTWDWSFQVLCQSPVHFKAFDNAYPIRIEFVKSSTYVMGATENAIIYHFRSVYVSFKLLETCATSNCKSGKL